ncbi:hypothetical protein E4U38_005997 [Claviceps purpurea]|nr:hypothetical protein E4U38_005997 [Claviceps purpurea]
MLEAIPFWFHTSKSESFPGSVFPPGTLSMILRARVHPAEPAETPLWTKWPGAGTKKYVNRLIRDTVDYFEADTHVAASAYPDLDEHCAPCAAIDENKHTLTESGQTYLDAISNVPAYVGLRWLLYWPGACLLSPVSFVFHPQRLASAHGNPSTSLKDLSVTWYTSRARQGRARNNVDMY